MLPDDISASLLSCPGCDGVLTNRPHALACTRCGTEHPVVANIPRFVPQDNYAKSFGYQWNMHRRTQLDSNTGMPISRDRLFLATRWPEDLHGSVVLEAGSGAGRFTEPLVRTGAQIYSFDYSAAVDANCANNGSAPNLKLFQADIYRIPVRKQAFDKVVCIGVLQHTPDPEEAFHSLAACVKPGGQLVIDVYAKRLTAVASWKYLLRPITRKLDQQRLYSIVRKSVDLLLPAAVFSRRIAGSLGARVLPIIEYSHLGLPPEVNREWAVLDTFDMYSPVHDHPQSLRTVKRWFSDVGFQQVEVENGANGIVGRGIRPSQGDA
jgi:SAM-dependent methyltransferase